MSRKSRIRKINSVTGSSINKSPDLHIKRSANDPREFNAAWARIQYECSKMKRKYPFLVAERRYVGPKANEWVIINKADLGDEMGPRLYRDIAIRSAELIGYHGGPEGAVQFWFDHMNGDHIIKEKLPEVNEKEIDFFTEYNDADMTRELHIGRYKQGGEWSDTSKDAPVKPMEIPRPVTMKPDSPRKLQVGPVKSESLIKVVSS